MEKRRKQTMKQENREVNNNERKGKSAIMQKKGK